MICLSPSDQPPSFPNQNRRHRTTNFPWSDRELPKAHQRHTKAVDSEEADKFAADSLADALADPSDPVFGLDDTVPQDAAIRLDPQDPFQIDPDAPLKIEGISESLARENAFGIKCPVCDTHLHALPDQIGSRIECPDCTSPIVVKRPEKPKKTQQRWKQYQPERSHIRPDDQLTLSEPIERPKVDFDIDPTFGLESVTEDLLAPKKAAEETAQPTELRDANSRIEATVYLESHLSRHHSPENRNGNDWKLLNDVNLQVKKQDPGEVGQAETMNQRNRLLPTSLSFPEFDMGSLTIAINTMFRSPGLLWRGMVAWLLMGVGWAIMHEFANSFARLAVAKEPSLGDWALNLFSRFLLGGIPFIAGTLLLWFVCGYVFRDSAGGKRQVARWGVSGTSELSSTFLVFAFSYLIAGLPLAFFPLLITPIRFLAAPPLLLAAWFNQSPFSIVSVDAFQTLKHDASQWKSFYSLMLVLAALSLVAGLLLMIPTFLLLWVFSLAGMALTVLLTIAFAAVTGWHCGRIIESLENHN